MWRCWSEQGGAKEPDQCSWEWLFVPTVYLPSSQDAAEGQGNAASSAMSLMGLKILMGHLSVARQHTEVKATFMYVSVCVCVYTCEHWKLGNSKCERQVQIMVPVRVFHAAGSADQINCLFSRENQFKASQKLWLKQNSFIKTFTPAAEEQ